MKTRTGSLIKRGKSYYCRYVVDGRAKVERLLDDDGCPIHDKERAESARARLMAPYRLADRKATLASLQVRIAGLDAELAQEAARRDAAAALPIAGAWDAYLRAGNRREMGTATLANYKGYWAHFAAWVAATHPDVRLLREVSFEVCERYREHLIARNVTGRTFNAHRAFLRSFWNVLAEKARTDANPWARLAKRDERPQGRRPLTVEELVHVCQAARGELRLLLAMGLYLGARLGDCCMMDWGAVDMVRRMVRYVPRKTARKAGGPLHVPIHPELLAILAETPERRRRGPVCPDLAARYSSRGADGVSDLVQAHFGACGLTTQVARHGAGVRRVVAVGFHSLRHTAVSLLREAGVAQSVSMAIAGHSDASVHALYTHTDEQAMRRAVGLLPSVSAKGHSTSADARAPAERLARIEAKVTAMSQKAVKRAVLRLLRLHRRAV